MLKLICVAKEACKRENKKAELCGGVLQTCVCDLVVLDRLHDAGVCYYWFSLTHTRHRTEQRHPTTEQVCTAVCVAQEQGARQLVLLVCS